jgi:hypothetical protein
MRSGFDVWSCDRSKGERNMRHIKTLVAATAVAFTLTAIVAVAQQPAHPQGGGQQPSAASPKSDQGHDALHAQHMEMCRQMMGQAGMMGGGMGPGMMGGGMMGMPMMVGGDPKQQADMMAMRGEVMKAMGDIMMKYAQRMQSGR